MCIIKYLHNTYNASLLSQIMQKNLSMQKVLSLVIDSTQKAIHASGIQLSCREYAKNL